MAEKHQLLSEVLNTCSDGLVYCSAKWAADVTGGAFWFFALLIFSIAVFTITSRFGSTRAFGFGSFIGMIGGIWLAILQLIPWWVGSTFIIVGIIGMISLIVSER